MLNFLEVKELTTNYYPYLRNNIIAVFACLAFSSRFAFHVCCRVDACHHRMDPCDAQATCIQEHRLDHRVGES